MRSSPAAVLSLLLLAGCQASSAPAPLDRAAAEPDVLEAVFRHQFEHNASGGQQGVDAYFLGIGEGGDRDPSPDFLARFAGHSPTVEPVSAASSSPDTGVTHRVRGGTGLIFRVTALRWIDDRTVEADGGYYEAGLSASGNTYRVEQREGRWTVTDDEMHWIS